MYEQFYGLEGKPFHLSPDPRFFFESHGHSRALAYLHYGIEQGEGFVVVTGNVGTGKTTLARMLHDELGKSSNVVVATLTITQCTGDQLLRMITAKLGIKNERRSKAAIIEDLDTFLRERHKENKRVLLIVDEVQNLPFDALEMLRMLSNLQETERPLIQSLLLGQAEFRNTLNGPNASQFSQRVIASCHLDPLNSTDETRAYIEHRLHQVGWQDDPAIETDAHEVIHQFTQGVPRRINTFCDRLLLLAYLEELHQIDRDTVNAVANEITSDFPALDEPATAQTGIPAVDGDTSESSRIEDLEARVRSLEQALNTAHDEIDKALGENSSE